MTQSETYQANVTIAYLNQRDGKRPPSIKDSNGNYYTISDAACAAGILAPGVGGQLTYYVNNRGYKVGTSWNGQELPQDQRGGGAPTTAAPSPAPAPGQQHVAASPVSNPLRCTADGKLLARARLAEACLSMGLDSEAFHHWWGVVYRNEGVSAPTPIPASAEAAPVQPPAPPQPAPQQELNDDIPF